MSKRRLRTRTQQSSLHPLYPPMTLRKRRRPQSRNRADTFVSHLDSWTDDVTVTQPLNVHLFSIYLTCIVPNRPFFLSLIPTGFFHYICPISKEKPTKKNIWIISYSTKAPPPYGKQMYLTRTGTSPFPSRYWRLPQVDRQEARGVNPVVP